ncbi:uncharacterized protein LOC111701790 [Eurytemora carolleeae]|uniref:uncharacterized protein LOC111701790 n=1 Tax=Eurytemora carolleeae TaxID=1294199 RepID=UPI000C76F6AC|nr:uncharacterized protein LOC111701790 [Eurytemora carolleeae]|eukprot:XP_023328980.1 uncharacterized protein LOC111701790 [Eurytemora affinis]
MLNKWFVVLLSLTYTAGERIRPQIDVSYEYVEEGDALDLRCNVRAHPPSYTIKWTWDKSNLDARVETLDIGSSHILRIHIHDNKYYDLEGHYYCRAENAVGETEAVLTIEEPVNGKLKIYENVNAAGQNTFNMFMFMFILVSSFMNII